MNVEGCRYTKQINDNLSVIKCHIHVRTKIRNDKGKSISYSLWIPV